jgi:hypothetical protein
MTASMSCFVALLYAGNPSSSAECIKFVKLSNKAGQLPLVEKKTPTYM